LSELLRVEDEVLMVLQGCQFAALLVGILALVALFKSRRTCRRCCTIFNAVLFWCARGLCPKCEAATGDESDEGIVHVLLLLVALALLIVCLLKCLPEELLRHLSTVVSDEFNFLFVGFVFLLFVVVFTYKAAPRWLRLLARQSERLDFRAARRASGHSGEVHRTDGFAIWTDCPGDWISSVRTTNAPTAEEFSRLTGIPAKLFPPARILCFGEEAAFSRYTAKIFPHFGRLGGFYQGRLGKKIILFRDLPDLPPLTFENILTHELTHHFTRCNLRARPLWLQEGLAELVSKRVGDATASDAPAQHRLKAGLARGQLLTGKELFSAGYRRLRKRMKDWRNLEDASYCGRLYTQSAALLAWLRRKDEEGFKRFFAGLVRTRRWRPVFRSSFGQSPEEALERWKAELQSQPLLPFPAVPPALEQRVRERLVSVAANAAAPRDERLLAIRWLGGGGYLCGAEALVAVLDNPADDLRPEAQRALENMAGEILGADAGAWRRWMLSLSGMQPAAGTAV
jgi:hypothetical protein